ncbi:MAG: hypothetical protein IJU81_03260 [Bacteroidales bacterium]|nr:hypothetical protein [Bacteroidales bacterium]
MTKTKIVSFHESFSGCGSVSKLPLLLLNENVLFAVVFALCSLVSCSKFEGGQEVPAYLTIDAIKVVDDNETSWQVQYGAGFFATQSIDAAEVSIYFEGDTAEWTLGVYQLPCKLPVLRKGVAQRVVIHPVIKQNGIASTRIAYPYYNEIKLSNVVLAEDSVTQLGTLNTTMNRFTKVVWHEFFEKIQVDVSLDTCVEILADNPELICTGTGSGVVHVPAAMTELNFWGDTTVTVDDPTAYLYLEMDYRTDYNLSVGIKGPSTAGGTEQTNSAIMLYANDHWQKIYINLGKVWRYHSHYPQFRLFFTAFNPDGKEGNVYLDNMKLLVL